MEKFNKDPREAFLESNLSRHSLGLTPEALEDLRFFAKRAKENKPITVLALLKWFKEKHGLKFGRTRLYSLAIENGIEPWWKP